MGVGGLTGHGGSGEEVGNVPLGGTRIAEVVGCMFRMKDADSGLWH
jgi:hypothetical protein